MPEGQPIPRQTVRCASELARDGVVQARGSGANALDSPLLAAEHAISMLKDQPLFEPIGAGEIVTTGTLTAALPIHSGETWSTEFSGIGFEGLSIQFRREMATEGYENGDGRRTPLDEGPQASKTIVSIEHGKRQSNSLAIR